MVSKRTNLKEVKKFFLILAGILLCIALLKLSKGQANTFVGLSIFSLLVFLAGTFFTKLLAPVYLVITKITHAIGRFNTGLLLCIIFYLIFTPIGLVLRLFRIDPLSKKIEKAKDSYWILTESKTDDYERQF